MTFVSFLAEPWQPPACIDNPVGASLAGARGRGGTEIGVMDGVGEAFGLVMRHVWDALLSIRERNGSRNNSEVQREGEGMIGTTRCAEV